MTQQCEINMFLSTIPSENRTMHLVNIPSENAMLPLKTNFCSENDSLPCTNKNAIITNVNNTFIAAITTPCGDNQQ